MTGHGNVPALIAPCDHWPHAPFSPQRRDNVFALNLLETLQSEIIDDCRSAR
jgi:hypothetical protein